ncbi:alpha/beta-Hydrolases superfamily protein, partial [Striga asiatica]
MTSKGGIDVGLMDNGSRKLRRVDVENDEEESDIIIVLLISLVAVLGAWYHNKYFIKEVPVKNDVRAERRELLMRSLCLNPTCFRQLRVNVHTFNKLCEVLHNEVFLHILAHDKKNSTTTSIFLRSGKTISRQFHTVLRAVLKIGKIYLKQQSDGLYNERDTRRWRWFPLSELLPSGLLFRIILPYKCLMSIKLDENNDKEIMNNKMKKGTKASMSINTKTSKRSFSAYDASTDHAAHAAVEVKHKQSYVSWNKDMDSNLAFILT